MPNVAAYVKAVQPVTHLALADSAHAIIFGFKELFCFPVGSLLLFLALYALRFFCSSCCHGHFQLSTCLVFCRTSHFDGRSLPWHG